MDDDTVETLLELVRVAFADVTRGTITLHEAEVIDTYGSDAERASARRRDTATRWTDVTDAQVEACRDALPHLDPQSWVFYLPAFMSCALRCTRRSNVPMAAVYALCPMGDASLNESRRNRYRWLTDDQAAAVYRFLRHVGPSVDRQLSEQALRGYWRRYARD